MTERTRTCGYHEEYDEQHEPVGPECGRPVTHVVMWIDAQKFSFTCDLDHPIDPRAPRWLKVTVDEWENHADEQILARYDVLQVDPL